MAIHYLNNDSKQLLLYRTFLNTKAIKFNLNNTTLNTSTEHVVTALCLQDLQSTVQQQRADMDSARDALTALCRSHPSQELSLLSSDLTSIAKRTEAVAQRCAKTRGNLQDELQLHFNSKTQEWSHLVKCFSCWLG